MKSKTLLLLALFCLSLSIVTTPTQAQEQMRPELLDRYEQMLLKSPLNDKIFGRVYDAYQNGPGVSNLLERLESKQKKDPQNPQLPLLLARIHQRQFEVKKAVELYEKSLSLEQRDPGARLLLANLYADEREDEKAIEQLKLALPDLKDSEEQVKAYRKLGELHSRHGRTKEAIAAWRKIVELSPGSVFAHLDLADIYEENGFLDEAINEHREIVRLAKDDPYRRCRSLRAIGRILTRQRKFKEAIETYQEALSLVSPRNWLHADLRGRLVAAYVEMGDIQGLIDYLNAKLEREPQDAESRELLAEAYTRQKKYGLAETQYKGILDRAPKRTDVREKLIRIYERAGNAARIKAELAELIKLLPNEVDYYRRLGQIYYDQGEKERAEKEWRLILDVKPPSSSNHIALANIYEQHDMPSKAIEQLKAAVKLSPDDAELKRRLGGALFFQGKEDQAKETWRKMLGDKLKTAEGLLELASIYRAHKLGYEAEDLVREAAKLDPKNTDARYQLGAILDKKEDYDKAIKEFELVRDNAKDELQRDRAISKILEILYRQNKLAAKRRELEKVLAENPKDLEKLDLLARIYKRLGDLPNSTRLLQQCSQVAPKETKYLLDLAKIYKRQRRFIEAADCFKKLINDDKPRARAYYRELAQIYSAADMKKEAIETGQRIVELSPGDPEARKQLAELYLRFDLKEKALIELRKAARLKSDSAEYQMLLIHALAQNDKVSEAIERCRRLYDTARRKSDRLEAVTALAMLQLRTGRADELVREFRDRLRETPKKLEAYEALAELFKTLGRREEAKEVYQEALEALGEPEEVLRKLVQACFEAEDYTSAARYGEQLVKRAGKVASREYRTLGEIYYESGQTEKAIQTWRKMVEANPDDARSYKRLASVLEKKGFIDEALEAVKRAVELSPDDLRLRAKHVQQLAAADRIDESIAEAQKILDTPTPEPQELKEDEDEEAKKRRRQVQQRAWSAKSYRFYYNRVRLNNSRYIVVPTWASTYSYRSRTGGKQTFEQLRTEVLRNLFYSLRNRGSQQPLVEHYEKQAKEHPDDVRLKNDLVLIYELTGRRDKAMEATEALAKASPQNTSLASKLLYYYASRKKLDKFLQLCSELTEKDPTHKTQYEIAKLSCYLNKGGEAEKAKDLLKRLADEHQDDSEVLSQLMQTVVGSQGNLEEAEPILARLLEMGEEKPEILMSIVDPLSRGPQKDKTIKVLKKIVMSSKLFSSYPYTTSIPSLYSPSGQQSSVYYTSFGSSYIPARNISFRFPRSWYPRSAPFPYPRARYLEQLARLMEEDHQTNDLLKEFQTLAQSEEESKRVEGILGQAIIHRTLGAPEKALELLTKAIEGNDGLRRLGLLNYLLYTAKQADEFQIMEKAYKFALEQFPGRKREAQLGLIAIYFEQGEREKALDAAAKFDKNLRSPVKKVKLARQLFSIGEPELAKQILDDLISKGIRNSQALDCLSDIYAKDGELEKAIELCAEARKRTSKGKRNIYYSYGYYSSSYGGSDRLLQKLIGLHQQAGTLDKLVQEYEKKAKKHPDSFSLQHELVAIYQRSGKRKEALDLIQKLIKKRPRMTRLKNQLAELYRQSGKYDEAINTYREIIEKRPSASWNLLWRLNNLYEMAGKEKEKRKMLGDLAKKTTDPNALQNLASQHQNNGDYEEAIKIWEKLLRIQPQWTHLHSDIARAYAALGKYDEAITQYRKSAESQSDPGRVPSISALKPMISLAAISGELSDIEDEVKKALEKDKDDKKALTLRACILLNEGKATEALAILERLVKDTQGYSSLRAELINLYKQTGRYKEALPHCDKAAVGLSYSPQGLGDIYYLTGDAKKAVKSWEKEYLDRYSGGYGYRQLFSKLIACGLYDDAGKIFLKAARRPIEEWTRADLSRTFAQHYSQGKFQDLPESVLAGKYSGKVKANLLVGLGRSLTQLNPPEYLRGIALLKKAGEISPKDPQTVLALIEALRKAEQLKEASSLLKDAFTRKVKLGTRARRTVTNVVESLFKAGLSDEASSLLQEAIAHKVKLDADIRWLQDMANRANHAPWTLEAIGAIAQKRPTPKNLTLWINTLIRAKQVEKALQTLEKHGAKLQFANLVEIAQTLIAAKEVEKGLQLIEKHGNELKAANLVKIAQGLIRAKQVEKALALVEENSDRLQPNNMIQIAKALRSAGERQRAIKILETVAQTSTEPSILLEIGNAHQAAGNAKKAQESFLKGMKADQQKGRWIGALAKLYFNHCRKKEALKLLDDSLSTLPPREEYSETRVSGASPGIQIVQSWRDNLYELGKILEQAGLEAKATEVFIQSLQKSDSRYYYQASRELTELMKQGHASRDVAKAIFPALTKSTRPYDMERIVQSVLTVENAESFVAPVEFLAQAPAGVRLKLTPAAYNLCQTMANSPHSAYFIPQLESISKAYPLNLLFKLCLAKAYRKAGKLEEAIKTLEEIIRSRPFGINNSEFRYAPGSRYAYGSSSGYSPSGSSLSLDAYSELARAYHQAASSAHANSPNEKTQEKAIEVLRNMTQIIRTPPALTLAAEGCFDVEALSDAEEFARAALKIDPAYIKAVKLLPKILFKAKSVPERSQGKTTEAADVRSAHVNASEALQRLLDLDSSSRTLKEWITFCLEHEAQDEAKKIAERLLSLYPSDPASYEAAAKMREKVNDMGAAANIYISGLQTIKRRTDCFRLNRGLTAVLAKAEETKQPISHETYEEVKKMALRLPSLHPYDPAAYEAAAKVHEKINEFGAAVQVYCSGLEKITRKPERDRLTRGLLVMLAKAEKTKALLPREYLKKDRERLKEFAKALSPALPAAGKEDTFLARFLETDADEDADVLRSLAGYYARRNLHEDALRCARKAIKLKPDMLGAYLSAITALSHLDKREDAAKALKDALACIATEESVKKRTSQYASLANTCSRAKAPKLAVEVWANAIASEKPDRELYEQAVRSLLALKEKEESLQDACSAHVNASLEKFQQNFASEPRDRATLAKLYEQCKEWQKALDIYRALRADGNLPSANVMSFLQCLRETGEEEEYLSLLHDVAEGGYGIKQKYEAIVALSQRQLEEGDATDLLPNMLAALRNSYGAQSQRAMSFFTQNINKGEVLDALVAEAKKFIAANPNDPLIAEVLQILVYAAGKRDAGKEERIDMRATNRKAVRSELLSAANIYPREGEAFDRWDSMMTDWKVIGPFISEAKLEEKGVKEYPPEREIDLDAEYDGLAGKVKWREPALVSFDRKVHFVAPRTSAKGTSSKANPSVRSARLNVSVATGNLPVAHSAPVNAPGVYFAVTQINSPSEMKAKLQFTSRSTLRIWLNGQVVLPQSKKRGSTERVEATLKQGANTILLRSAFTSSRSGFKFWITDKDGKPIKSLSTTDLKPQKETTN